MITPDQTIDFARGILVGAILSGVGISLTWLKRFRAEVDRTDYLSGQLDEARLKISSQGKIIGIMQAEIDRLKMIWKIETNQRL